MKTSEKTPKPVTKTGGRQKDTSQAEELKTEGPLSEKDEVKQAEQNTQKQQGKGR